MGGHFCALFKYSTNIELCQSHRICGLYLYHCKKVKGLNFNAYYSTTCILNNFARYFFPQFNTLYNLIFCTTHIYYDFEIRSYKVLCIYRRIWQRWEKYCCKIISLYGIPNNSSKRDVIDDCSSLKCVFYSRRMAKIVLEKQNICTNSNYWWAFKFSNNNTILIFH